MNYDTKYLNEKQTSELTDFSTTTLRNHRHLGKGIPYIKAGRKILYDRQDIEEYMERHKIQTDTER